MMRVRLTPLFLVALVVCSCTYNRQNSWNQLPYVSGFEESVYYVGDAYASTQMPESISIFYSEPLLDAYNSFSIEWRDYNGNIGKWFGDNLEAKIKSVKRTLQSDGQEVPVAKVEMKNDDFWTLESKQLHQKTMGNGNEFVADKLISLQIPKKDSLAGEKGWIVSITPVSMVTYDAMVASKNDKPIMRCDYKMVVMDAESGEVLLYEWNHFDGVFSKNPNGHSKNPNGHSAVTLGVAMETEVRRVITRALAKKP